MKIDRVEVRVVAPDVLRFTWSHDLPEQFVTNTLVRIFTDDGAEGVGAVANYTSFDFERYTAETLRHMIPILIGEDPLDREGLWKKLLSRTFPTAPGALAVLDIALWDLYGRIENKPIYQLLGGTRNRIPSYASTPLLDDIPAYLDLVDEFVAAGFGAVKFHAWCLPDKDLELARAVRRHRPGSDVAFMMDAENNYDRESALRVARELQDLDFTWFEAPLPDNDFDGYRQLTAETDIPVLPSGNWVQDLHTFTHAISSQAWKTARTDVTMCQGFTPGRRWLEVVDAAGIRCEIMCWGFNLIAAANLHFMLGSDSCTYFEQPVPYEPYEYGMIETLRTGADGFAMAPDGPGLGLAIDWDAMEAATIHSL